MSKLLLLSVQPAAIKWGTRAHPIARGKWNFVSRTVTLIWAGMSLGRVASPTYRWKRWQRATCFFMNYINGNMGTLSQLSLLRLRLLRM
jgi:hypothetical protein